MNSIDVFEPLLAPIDALQKLIEAFDDQGIIIGGVAASILGKPRLTADADAMILSSVEDIPQLIERAKKEGLVPRPSTIPLEELCEKYGVPEKLPTI